MKRNFVLYTDYTTKKKMSFLQLKDEHGHKLSLDYNNTWQP